MDSQLAVEALGALAHDTRLGIFRLLVQQGPTGLSAGDIAEKLAVPPSSLSFHLAHLRRAGLVLQRRESRQLIYSTHYAGMNELMGYLTENCCVGDGTGCATDCSPALLASLEAKRKTA